MNSTNVIYLQYPEIHDKCPPQNKNLRGTLNSPALQVMQFWWIVIAVCMMYWNWLFQLVCSFSYSAFLDTINLYCLHYRQITALQIGACSLQQYQPALTIKKYLLKFHNRCRSKEQVNISQITRFSIWIPFSKEMKIRKLYRVYNLAGRVYTIVEHA